MVSASIRASATWDLLTCDTVDQRGTMHWYDESGRHHRENGPAVIYADGTQYWAKHGKRHREDGPAVIWASGRIEYWIDNQSLTEEQFNVYRYIRR